MSKMIIIEGNSNDKNNIRNYLVKGERGYSAYELYVQNGGTLTEEEWLDAFLNADNYYTKDETDDLLDNKSNIADIVDNLTSTDTNKPLSANQGKELNDNKANASDVYTKNETNTLLSDKADNTALTNYKLKNDFAIITGSLLASASAESGVQFAETQQNIEYPDGFNNLNCVCVSFGTTRDGKIDLYNFDGSSNIASTSTGILLGNLPKAVNLKSNKINIRVYNYSGSDITIYYKLVLMKIS